MKKMLITVLSVLLLINTTVAIAASPGTEKSVSEFTYYKVGILWDVSGLTVDSRNQDVKDLHVDGKIQNIRNLFGLENINYKKEFAFSILNLTIVCLVSQEPLE